MDQDFAVSLAQNFRGHWNIVNYFRSFKITYYLHPCQFANWENGETRFVSSHDEHSLSSAWSISGGSIGFYLKDMIGKVLIFVA